MQDGRNHRFVLPPCAMLERTKKILHFWDEKKRVNGMTGRRVWAAALRLCHHIQRHHTLLRECGCLNECLAFFRTDLPTWNSRLIASSS